MERNENIIVHQLDAPAPNMQPELVVLTWFSASIVMLS
jgi:hypothetical protein